MSLVRTNENYEVLKKLEEMIYNLIFLNLELEKQIKT